MTSTKFQHSVEWTSVWVAPADDTPEALKNAMFFETGYHVKDEDGDNMAFVPVSSWDTTSEVFAAFLAKGFIAYFNEDDSVRCVEVR